VTYEESTRTLRLKRPDASNGDGGDGSDGGDDDDHLIELSIGAGLSHKVKPFDCSADPHGSGDYYLCMRIRFITNLLTHALNVHLEPILRLLCL
jgi:hypothetical protein